jgi:hypothetical protein
MWRKSGLDGRLTHEEVVAGFARWLERAYSPMWDIQTSWSTRWHLQRKVGLRGWALDEARSRLAAKYRLAWSALDFHEFIFCEDIWERKHKALKDPFWSPLFLYKQLSGEDKFFKVLPLLLHQGYVPYHSAKRLYAIWYDRLPIPFAWWSYSAAARYLEESLAKTRRHALAPSAELLRQWARRLRLPAQRPAIITQWNRGIPHGGFNESAYLNSPIPKLHQKKRNPPNLEIDAAASEGKRPSL